MRKRQIIFPSSPIFQIIMVLQKRIGDFAKKNRESESFVISGIQQVMPGILSLHFPKSDGRMHNDKWKEMPCLTFKWKFLQT